MPLYSFPFLVQCIMRIKNCGLKSPKESTYGNGNYEYCIFIGINANIHNPSVPFLVHPCKYLIVA